jgi:hypothetical protein
MTTTTTSTTRLPTLTSVESLQELVCAAFSREPVDGLTHTFYRYPARFSPEFARAAIRAFTKPGDVILDPFMGGGTSIVEARALGRRAVGMDISALSHFLTQAKAIPLPERDLLTVKKWITNATRYELNVRRSLDNETNWAQLGYHRNIQGRSTWAIRKILRLAVLSLDELKGPVAKAFARALLLRTAQWALDCRTDVPTATRFRQQLLVHFDEMIEGARAYRKAVKAADASYDRSLPRILLLHRSAAGIDKCSSILKFGPPKLVLTSPPYPGVHVMYHRWQVLGRKETPAPFWIANVLDGHGLSYYTFGDRHNPGLKTYFRTAQNAFESVARLGNDSTIFIQMIAFSDPSWQLRAYLETMEAAGLIEVRLPQLATEQDGRLWRTVPNRKWYATKRGQQGAAREVVLLHRRQD